MSQYLIHNKTDNTPNVQNEKFLNVMRKMSSFQIRCLLLVSE